MRTRENLQHCTAMMYKGGEGHPSSLEKTASFLLRGQGVFCGEGCLAVSAVVRRAIWGNFSTSAE